MKTYKTPFVRWIGSVLTVSFWTALAAVGWLTFIKVVVALNRIQYPARHDRLEEQAFGTGGLTLVAVLGILCFLARLTLLRTRYEVGARELVAHQGFLWRSTTTLPLLTLGTIEVSSGPLMRLFGLADLKVAGTTLYGIREAEELKAFLLARRDALQEAVRMGELEVGQTTGELVQERLAKAIERLDGRLRPGA